MATCNVALPDPLEQEIENLVRSGRYQNASEVIRAGVRLLLQHEAEDAAKLDALRKATSQGIMELESGRYDDVPGEDLMQYLDTLDPQTPQPDR